MMQKLLSKSDQISAGASPEGIVPAVVTEIMNKVWDSPPMKLSPVPKEFFDR
jgi:hypothetical protein